MTARLKASPKSEHVAGFLDIGTAKTACLIVSMAAEGHPIAVLGSGVRTTRGLKAGVVVEMDGVEQAVRGALAAAEEAAGVHLPDIALSIACGRLRAQTFAADAAIARYAVSAQDIERVLHAGAAFAQKDGRLLLDLRAIAFRVDGVPGTGDPTGVPGRSLGADLVAVTADQAPVGNLVHVVGRADAAATRLIAAPQASGLAATTAAQRAEGVLCVDLGAGTTELSLFVDGHLVLCDVIPVGGNHITFDIARALSTTLLEAERIKTEHATLSRNPYDLHEVFAYACASGSAGGRMETTRGALRPVIEARVLGLFEHVAERVERSGLAHFARRLMVLTGGASRLAGLADLAAQTFERPVQPGHPPALPGLPAAFAGPEFATVAGMALAPRSYRLRADGAGADDDRGYLQRVGRWLRGSG